MKTIAALLAVMTLTACANHCRIDQTPPADATFEDAERLTREQCK